MDTLDRTFWLAFEQDLASLTPLVHGLLERGDWAASDLYSSVDGVELVEATWRLFGLRDRLATATHVSAQDRLDLRAFLMGKPEWTPSITPAPDAVSSQGGSEPFTDEEEVREKVADSIATSSRSAHASTPARTGAPVSWPAWTTNWLRPSNCYG